MASELEQPADGEGPAMTWTNHPYRERPTTSAIVTLAVVGSWWLGWHLVGWFGFGLAVVLTLSALGPYLFPSFYRVDSSGASARTLWQTRHVTWDELGGYDVYPDAIQLVLDSASLRARVQKGLLLPTANCDAASLRALVEHYLPTE